MLCGSFHLSKARWHGFLRVNHYGAQKPAKALSVIVPLLGRADEVVE
jgi:hypothetical protein